MKRRKFLTIDLYRENFEVGKFIKKKKETKHNKNEPRIIKPHGGLMTSACD